MGDLEGLKILCKNNPSIDLDASDYDGRTALHMAATEGHIEILQFLAKNKLKEINPTDRWGNTPLEDAQRCVFQEVVEFVKEMGGLTRCQLRK
jgi:glutaminase